MIIFIITFCVIFMVMLAMGVGLFFKRSGIKGTCGGPGKIIDGEQSCEFCSKNKVRE